MVGDFNKDFLDFLTIKEKGILKIVMGKEFKERCTKIRICFKCGNDLILISNDIVCPKCDEIRIRNYIL